MDQDLDAGDPRAELVDVARAGTSDERCSAPSKAARGFGDGLLREFPPNASAWGSQTGIVSSGMPMAAQCCGPSVDRGKTARAGGGQTPLEAPASRIGSRCRRCRPLTAESLQAGGRIDVGDRRDVVDIDHFGKLLPAILRPARSRPCRPSSSRRPCRAGRRGVRPRTRPTARAGWRECQPSRP